jgi:hypothetical protein
MLSSHGLMLPENTAFGKPENGGRADDAGKDHWELHGCIIWSRRNGFLLRIVRQMPNFRA